eukprot:GFUD01002145.1.p1 GENE.GFUD01002145.1~~GFUD01002145.1.p1  ORF type:complete len:1062 (+),score=232.76 GFUD01002145.1:94-3279(+)
MADLMLVKSVYKFKGTNNDELKFKKGDIITITQKEDGGWWEGTLDGKTGWFPSNYVEELPKESKEVLPSVQEISEEVIAKNIDYRQQVISDLLEKEQEFVSDLRGLLNQFLQPLHHADILTDAEYDQLVGNIEELIEAHQRLNSSLEDVRRSQPRHQRLGQVFLQHGAGVRAAHLAYWANHPRAVCILEKHRDKLNAWLDNCQTQTNQPPGLMVLTTGLSRPFRQLERLAGAIQEVAQHLEDDHIDRGDTQRSIGFYKESASEAARARRQRELELEVLTGTIRGWEGEGMDQLGDIVKMGAVVMGHGLNKKDKYLVLFPSTLLMLSVSNRLSAFIYEGKLPLSGLSITRPDTDTDNTRDCFDISGPLIETLTCTFPSRAECQDWHEKITSQIRTSRQSAILPNKLSVQPLPPPHVSYTTTPPYVQLTAWIRGLLAHNQLTPEHIKSMRKAVRVVSQSVTKPRYHRVECVIYPTEDDSVKKKTSSEYKSDVKHSKSPVTLKEPSVRMVSSSTESNPFGFIHYIATTDHKNTHNIVVEGEDLITLVLPSDNIEINDDEEIISYHDDEMTFLLPRSLLNSSLESMSIFHSQNDNLISQLGVSHETDESSSPCHPGMDTGGAPWGKRLPNYNDQFQSQQFVNYERYRVASEGYFGPHPNMVRPPVATMLHSSSVPMLNKTQARPRPRQGQSKQEIPAFTKEESPPSWISCFPSPKSKRKSGKIPKDVYTKTVDDSPIKYIDKTPSENSLNLPYCPPVQIDYEHFSNSELFNLNNTSMKLNEMRVDSPKIPKRRAHSKIRSRSLSRTRTSQLAVIPIDDSSTLEKPQQHYSQVVAQIEMYPNPKSPQLIRCTCDSRRSSDSGLADMVTHADHCPLYPHSTKGSSQSMASIPLHMSPVSPCSSGLSRISSNPSSSRQIYKHPKPQTPTDLHQISEIQQPPPTGPPPRRTSAQSIQCTCSANRQIDHPSRPFNSTDSHTSASFHPPPYQYTRSPTSNYPHRSSNSNDPNLTQDRERPQLTTLHSLSLDDIQSPYREQADQAFSCSDIPDSIPGQTIQTVGTTRQVDQD